MYCPYCQPRCYRKGGDLPESARSSEEPSGLKPVGLTRSSHVFSDRGSARRQASHCIGMRKPPTGTAVKTTARTGLERGADNPACRRWGESEHVHDDETLRRAPTPICRTPCTLLHAKSKEKLQCCKCCKCCKSCVVVSTSPGIDGPVQRRGAVVRVACRSGTRRGRDHTGGDEGFVPPGAARARAAAHAESTGA